MVHRRYNYPSVLCWNLGATSAGQGVMKLREQRAGRLRAAVLGLAVAASALAACATTSSNKATSSSDRGRPEDVAANSGSRIGRVPALAKRGPTIAVDAVRGCPRSLGRAVDVRNDFADRDASLLPIGHRPTRGLVCQYGRASSPSITTKLLRAVPVHAAQAERLAAAVSAVSLMPAQGRFSCPADFYGAVTIIALSYPAHLTVTLWYKTAGCRTVDNGDVLASQGANPSFYAGFQSALESVAPGP